MTKKAKKSEAVAVEGKPQVLTSLTPEQEAKLPEYRDYWNKVGLNTSRVDEAKAKTVVEALYANANFKAPAKIHFADSPIAAMNLARKLGAKDVSYDDFYWGQHEAGNMGFYAFFLHEVKCKGIDKMQLLIDACETLGWSLFYEECAIVCQRPTEIHLDDQNRLSNDKGAAVRFADNLCNVYAVHGVRVQQYVIEEPEKITVKDIEAESNAEVRRVKINQFGQARYMTESGSKVVHEDDYGTLLSKSVVDDEPLMMVKVVNSTQEPDGTFKDYFIRVDPNAYGGLKIAKHAVASTWRNPDGSMMFPDPEKYNLVEES